MTEWTIYAAFVMLTMALVLTLVRLLRGPSLPDRVVALDLLAYLAIGFTAVATIASGHEGYLTVALVIGLFVFLGTIAFARYIERAKAGENVE